MKKVKLQLDYFQGPIWISDTDTGEPLTGIDVIDNDPKVRELNKKIYDLFDTYFEFESHGMHLWYDYEKEKKDKDLMLSLLKQLNDRLAEINDGSYVVEDYLTDYYKNL